MSQPGAAWNYSLSTDVLGRVVEVASGQPFDQFVRERILTPLGMTDTSFEVPDARWSRMATVYSPDGAGGIRPMKDPESFGNTVMSPVASYKAPKTYFSGGAGLTSTARDYARFAQMLLGGGALDKVRLLGPKSVEMMTANHTRICPRAASSSAAAPPSASASASSPMSPQRRRSARTVCSDGAGFMARSSGSTPKSGWSRS